MNKIALASSLLALIGCTESEKMYESPISGEKYTLAEVASIDNCVQTGSNPAINELRKADYQSAQYVIRSICEGFVLGNRLFE